MKQLLLPFSPRQGWLDQVQLPRTEKKLLRRLAEPSIDGGSVFVAQTVLAQYLDLSPRHVSRLTGSLERRGLILRLGARGDRYIVRWAELGDLVALQKGIRMERPLPDFDDENVNPAEERNGIPC